MSSISKASEDVSFLGLSSHHQQIVVEYLHSSRFKRTQSLKAIDSTLQDLLDSRLVEDTFTSDEVREMLKGFCGVVKADVGADLINTSHTSAQLLRHILQQADKWHLALQADISEMDNSGSRVLAHPNEPYMYRELLDEIAQFEERELNISPTHSFSQFRKQLEPVNTSGGEKLLNLEISRLEKENQKLKERIHSLESKVSNALSEKDKIKSDLVVAQQVSREPSESSSVASAEEISELQAKIGQLQAQLSEKSTRDGNSLQEELSKTAQEFLKVTAELKTTQQELELKFSETAQYTNMRKMLETKNATIKELRAKLKKYDPDGK